MILENSHERLSKVQFVADQMTHQSQDSSTAKREASNSKSEIFVAEYYINPTNVKFDGPDMYLHDQDFYDNDPVLEEIERKKEAFIEKCYANPHILYSLIANLEQDTPQQNYQHILDVLSDFEFRTKRDMPTYTDPWISLVADENCSKINQALLQAIHKLNLEQLKQPVLHTLLLIIKTHKDLIICNDELSELLPDYITKIQQEKDIRDQRTVKQHEVSKKAKKRQKKIKYLEKKYYQQYKTDEAKDIDTANKDKEEQKLLDVDIAKASSKKSPKQPPTDDEKKEQDDQKQETNDTTQSN